MNGLNQIQLTYCHEFDWATQSTSNFKGAATSGESLACSQDEYIKGVNVKLTDVVGSADQIYAIRDGGAGAAADSYWTSDWYNPTLDESMGFHNNPCNSAAIWTITMPSNQLYLVD